MKSIFSKFWPFIFLFVLWFAFASPYFLQNKVPFPSTLQATFFAPWSAYPEIFWGPVKNNAQSDVITQIYPWRHLAVEIWKSGQIPLWNPYVFSGTPLLANYQSAVLSPFNLIFLFLPFIDGWSVLVLLQPLLAGLFMFLFARSLKISTYGSVISSLAFMFSGFITTWMSYGTLGYAILFLPLALYSLENFFNSKKLRFLILFSLTFPLSFFSGHFQISLYFSFVVFAYILFRFVISKDLTLLFYPLLYGFVGFLLSAPQLLPSFELFLNAQRSGIVEKMEAIPLGYIPTLLAPDFFGNPVTRNDWYGHYAEWSGFIGVIPIMLAVYAILFKKGNRTIFFSVIAILSLLLALDTPLLNAFVNLRLPVLSSSAASRILSVFVFSVAVLAGFGFDRLKIDIIKNKKIVLSWLLVFLLLFLFLWLFTMFKILSPEKTAIARKNLILPTIAFFIAFLAILTTLFNKKVLLLTFSLLILISALDLFRFAFKWQSFDEKKLVFAENETTKFLETISGKRAYGNFGGEVFNYYKIKSIEGNDPLYIARYGELVSALEDGKPGRIDRYLVTFPKQGRYGLEMMNITGVEYLIHKKSDGRMNWLFPFWDHLDQFKPYYQNEKFEVLRNEKAMPHAFLVKNYKVADNKDNIIPLMFSSDLTKTVILEKDPKIDVGTVSGKIVVKKDTPNELILDVASSENVLLYVSDNYFPGWTAEIDGVKTEILRANYSFRAIPVKKGSNSVKLFYDPFSFKIGVGMFFVGVFLLLLSIFFFPRILARRQSSFS